MKTRQEYIEGLKGRLDAWNADVEKWEVEAHSSREQAYYQLRQLQAASSSAWTEFTCAADEAWNRMNAAVTKARSHLEKCDKK